MEKRQKLWVATLIVIAGFTMAGCAASTESTSTSPTPTTAAASVPVTKPVQGSEPSPDAAAPSTTQAVATMPNVVCMNLQAAQDKIQEAGVFFSRSKDATGAGRKQVLDSNWVVVAQTPAAGETVTEGQAVLSVVKVGEQGAC
ncbi:hypothetical protein GOEFS_132_00650 [Gordonia effusa NBRC 100432]|uniref:PASTA domain-containing protein n=1 Tax=Gordonia effusa NBRC 100432 TaxID=1077974 RepID=H0R6Y3_9ACTN|nr:PASTA domain-containing protein [Gordonia effusa]GAB20834.1 hypothetical protein GOEFS_132_00650 [Gordonia effusa NBRC 100432]